MKSLALFSILCNIIFTVIVPHISIFHLFQYRNNMETVYCTTSLPFTLLKLDLAWKQSLVLKINSSDTSRWLYCHVAAVTSHLGK